MNGISTRAKPPRVSGVIEYFGLAEYRRKEMTRGAAPLAVVQKSVVATQGVVLAFSSSLAVFDVHLVYSLLYSRTKLTLDCLGFS